MPRDTIDQTRTIEEELRREVLEEPSSSSLGVIPFNLHPLAAPLLLIAEKLDAIRVEMLLGNTSR